MCAASRLAGKDQVFYEMKYLRKMMQCFRKLESKIFLLQPPIHQSLAQSHYGTTGRQAADRGGGNFRWKKFLEINHDFLLQELRGDEEYLSPA